jgi:hypothetical protein
MEQPPRAVAQGSDVVDVKTPFDLRHPVVRVVAKSHKDLSGHYLVPKDVLARRARVLRSKKYRRENAE